MGTLLKKVHLPLLMIETGLQIGEKKVPLLFLFNFMDKKFWFGIVKVRQVRSFVV